MSTSIIFLAIPVAPASLLHTLVHLEHLCSSSGFHMLLRSQPSCCSHCARAGESPVCMESQFQASPGWDNKNIFPNTRWITGPDLQFCLHEGLGCCTSISRLDCIWNDVCLCSNRKVKFQLRWVLPVLASAYQQRYKYMKENKTHEGTAAWV